MSGDGSRVSSPKVTKKPEMQGARHPRAPMDPGESHVAIAAILSPLLSLLPRPFSREPERPLLLLVKHESDQLANHSLPHAIALRRMRTPGDFICFRDADRYAPPSGHRSFHSSF